VASLLAEVALDALLAAAELLAVLALVRALGFVGTGAGTILTLVFARLRVARLLRAVVRAAASQHTNQQASGQRAGHSFEVHLDLAI
jgi:hypothetical protein